MKFLSLVAAALIVSFTVGAGDADAAKRIGAAKSSGMQRQMAAPDKAPTTSMAPAPTAASSAAKAPGAVPQAQPKRSWMGPLAGLAAGLGLAALASHFGFGEELASMLMIGMLVMAAIAVIGLIMRRKAAGPQAAMAASNGMQYAASPVDDRTVTASEATAAGPGTGSAGNVPVDFDAPGFLRNAKVHFIRLQAANDAGNLDDIREFTTPEMFAELKMNISERGGATQATDVVSIDARMVEVVEEGNRYIASVRFTGLIREDGAAAEPVDEVWHLTKPQQGQGGWVLAGIQQIQ